MGRQLLLQIAAQLVGKRRTRLICHHVSSQPRFTGDVFAHNDGHGTHIRMLAEHGLNFLHLHPESKNLDLIVDAAQELDIAIRAKPRQIAGPVHALVRPERVHGKSLGGRISGRCRYPRTTPAPPMDNSPEAPMGSGLRFSSRM